MTMMLSRATQRKLLVQILTTTCLLEAPDLQREREHRREDQRVAWARSVNHPDELEVVRVVDRAHGAQPRVVPRGEVVLAQARAHAAALADEEKAKPVNEKQARRRARPAAGVGLEVDLEDVRGMNNYLKVTRYSKKLCQSS